MDLTGTNVDYYSKVLDLLAQRHRVIANNVANVNTPGYHTKDIDFKDIISQLIDKKESVLSEPASKPDFNVEFKEVFAGEGFDNKGINDVDMDREMVKLATNTLLYKMYVQKLTMHINQMNMAIKEKI